MPDFSILALKLALAAKAPEPEPTIDMQPVLDKLEELNVTLGVISRAPRQAAAP